MHITRGALVALLIACALFGVPSAYAADLPKATQAILAQLDKDDTVLAGVDKELAVPASWLAGARQEGTFKLTGTWDDKHYRAMIKPFEERYPFIKVQYRAATTHENRVIGTLMAFQEIGRAHV